MRKKPNPAKGKIRAHMLTDKEAALIIDALRCLQRCAKEVGPRKADHIDRLCERLNFGN